MKIMFIIATNTSGGAERVISLLANELAETGHEVVLTNFDKDSSFYQLSPLVDNIKLSKHDLNLVNLHGIRRMLRIEALLRKEIINKKPDIVIPFLFSAELPTYIASFRTHTNCITSVRNSANQYPLYQRLIRQIVFRKINGVVFQSEMVRTHKDFRKVKNATVIMNPVGYDINKTIKEKAKGKIISVGRLDRQKNHELTIRAIADLRNEFPNIVLHIYGEGPEREKLELLIKQLNVSGNVVLEGVQKNAVVLNDDAEVFIMASRYEGFPNALAEAMASGIPVICSNFDSGVATELLGNNERGLLFEVDNKIELITKLREVLLDSNSSQTRAELALDFCKRLQPKVIAKQWEHFIIDSI